MKASPCFGAISKFQNPTALGPLAWIPIQVSPRIPAEPSSITLDQIGPPIDVPLLFSPGHFYLRQDTSAFTYKEVHGEKKLHLKGPTHGNTTENMAKSGFRK